MAALLTRLWGWLKAFARVVFPVVGKASKSRGLWMGFLWILHIILVIAVLVGLYFLSDQEIVAKNIERIPRSWKGFFLPALAVLVYGLLWLGWYLWKLLTPEQEETVFPDIETAWREAVQAMEQAGIGLSSAPLFLVFGRPGGTEEALFEASGMPFPVKRVPPRAASPLHVYAGPDAIFVTCAGASLLGDLAAILSGVKEPIAEDGEFDGSASIRLGGGTMLPNANLVKIQKILRGAQGRKLNEDEHRELGKLYARGEVQQGHMVTKAKQSLLKDPQKVALASARLRRLCQLIARDRRPFCSVNGMLCLVPAGGAATDSDASLTGEICQRDYGEARRTLQVDCPIFALVSDLETVPGFREFRGSFGEDELSRRVGQSFPLVPDLPADEVSESINNAVQWIGNATIPGWVYTFFQVEKTGERSATVEVLSKNARLYQFLGTMRERMGRLGRILTNGLLKQQDEQPLFAGCYIAGTGRAENDQAFVAGVFRRLLGEQDNVAWSQGAIEEEAGYQRMIGVGYIILAILAIVDVALIVLLVYVLNKIRSGV